MKSVDIITVHAGALQRRAHQQSAQVWARLMEPTSFRWMGGSRKHSTRQHTLEHTLNHCFRLIGWLDKVLNNILLV